MTSDEFADLDIKNQVSKTLILTTDASLIWNEFNTQQPGFFVECIKKDYGIGNNFSEKVIQDFNDEISKIHRHNEINVAEISKSLQHKIDAQYQMICQQSTEKEELVYKFGPALEDLKTKIEQSIIKESEAQINEIMDVRNADIEETKEMNQILLNKVKKFNQGAALPEPQEIIDEQSKQIQSLIDQKEKLKKDLEESIRSKSFAEFNQLKQDQITKFLEQQYEVLHIAHEQLQQQLLIKQQ